MHYNYLNQLSQNTYEPKYGNVLSSISIQGDFVSNEYNANGNLIKSTAPNGSVTNYATQWEQHSLSSKVMYSDYVQNDDYTTIKKYYNLSGQLILSSNRNLSNTEVFEKFEYDTKGRVIKQTKPFLIDQQESEKKHILYTYDKLDRLRKTDDNGRITRTDYSFEFDVAANCNLLNPGQNQKIECLMLNEQTTQSYKLYTYNTDNELANITDNSTSISFLHHANGQLLSSTTAGVTTTYEYDYQGNRLLLIEPNAGSILSEYSPLGELTKQTDARGYVTEFSYNDFGQLISKKVTPPTGIASTTNYQYITSGRARNNPSTITSTDVNQTFLYDGEGRLKTYTESIQGQNFTKHYTYDKLDNIIQVIYPSGFSEKREYTKGNLKRIRRGDNNHLIWEATNFNYLDMNTVNTFGNELKQYISYDDRFNIQSQVVKYQTQTPIYHHTYTFDNITGNLNQHKDIVHGLEETFVFDNTDRLTEASNNPTGSTPQVAMQVQYHPNGNIKKKTDVSSIDYSYASTPPHAVTGIADPNLSGTTSFNQVIQYNHANRPTQILYNTHQINFVYASDDERRKTEQLDNNQLVKTKYFFSNFEREITAAGITKDFHYIYANGNLVSVMVQTANTKDMYYTCTDYLDNINLVINQSKTVAQENSFDAWGRRRNVNTWSHTNVTNPTLLQRGYTGHEHLDDFGLINMNARLYDPLIGRMLSPDNVLFDVTNSQNYNKYTYVLNNPLRYTDPTGNVPQGGLSQALTPGGLSHIGFYDAYNEFRTQTAQEEKNQMLEQLLMDAGGGGASSDGDPIIPRGQASQYWIGEIGFGSRLTPNSRASMRQTDAYLATVNNAKGVRGIGQPGNWESIIPVWGSGRAAVDHFQNGNYWSGLGYTTLAISDAFLVKSIATGISRGVWKLGSHSWSATRNWLGKNGYAKAGQPVHHWAVTQSTAKKYGIERLTNQPWNLKTFPSQSLHMRAGHGMNYLGQPGYGALGQFWYGTPTWFKAGMYSGGGRVVN